MEKTITMPLALYEAYEHTKKDIEQERRKEEENFGWSINVFSNQRDYYTTEKDFMASVEKDCREIIAKEIADLEEEYAMNRESDRFEIRELKSDVKYWMKAHNIADESAEKLAKQLRRIPKWIRNLYDSI